MTGDRLLSFISFSSSYIFKYCFGIIFNYYFGNSILLHFAANFLANLKLKYAVQDHRSSSRIKEQDQEYLGSVRQGHSYKFIK